MFQDPLSYLKELFVRKKDSRELYKMLNNNRKKSISLVNLQQHEVHKLKKINSLQLFYASTGKLPSTSSKISLNTHNQVIEEILQKNYQFREIKLNVYKKRWFLLIILILTITISFMQWLQFCIISNIIEIFYETSSDVVNLTSLIYMVLYAILFVPVTYYCEIHVSGLNFFRNSVESSDIFYACRVSGQLQ